MSNILSARIIGRPTRSRSSARRRASLKLVESATQTRTRGISSLSIGFKPPVYPARARTPFSTKDARRRTSALWARTQGSLSRYILVSPTDPLHPLRMSHPSVQQDESADDREPNSKLEPLNSKRYSGPIEFEIDLEARRGRLSVPCESAWNEDPVFGVIGIQSGPSRQWVHSGFREVGDAGNGDDRENPSRVFVQKKPIKGDLPRASRSMEQATP